MNKDEKLQRISEKQKQKQEKVIILSINYYIQIKIPKKS